MDKSFLSQPQIIKAARDFICVRLATYEDAGEAAMLKAVFRGRDPNSLENTTFCIMSPDGTRKLTRSGRSPSFVYQNALQMAAAMMRLSAQYKANVRNVARDIPKMASVRLALNVAACDKQPLLVLRTADAISMRKLQERMAAVAWGDVFTGQFIYAATIRDSELAKIKGIQATSHIVVVQPDQFGQTGSVLSQIPMTATDAELVGALNLALTRFQRSGSNYQQDHVARGRRMGILWKTVLPITDGGRSRPR